MSIDDAFKKMLDGIRLADEGRDEIMRGLEAAWSARRDLNTQLTELRDTIARLEGLVLDQGRIMREQGAELHALRQRLNGR